MISQAVKNAGLKGIKVIAHDGLTIRLAEELEADVMIRGIRSIKDMEYEIDIATLNKVQNNRVETVFLVADKNHRSISSTMVKEIAHYGGDISQLVPANIAEALTHRVKQRRSD
ncbi:Phosphopantetheine adenylyltransferase [Alkalibacterium sp. AK22]|nr:Phosphopantetheine adenylyltransferase [Alkalibacterium sp. AK22]